MDQAACLVYTELAMQQRQPHHRCLTECTGCHMNVPPLHAGSIRTAAPHCAAVSKRPRFLFPSQMRSCVGHSTACRLSWGGSGDGGRGRGDGGGGLTSGLGDGDGDGENDGEGDGNGDGAISSCSHGASTARTAAVTAFVACCAAWRACLAAFRAATLAAFAPSLALAAAASAYEASLAASSHDRHGGCGSPDGTGDGLGGEGEGGGGCRRKDSGDGIDAGDWGKGGAGGDGDDGPCSSAVAFGANMPTPLPSTAGKLLFTPAPRTAPVTPRAAP